MLRLSIAAKPAHTPSTIKVHQSETEVESLRSFWTELQHHPNSDIDHFLLVCRLRSLSPCVLSLWDGGACRCIVVGRVEPLAMQPRIGYLKLPSLGVRALTFINEGVIGSMGPIEAEQLGDRVAQLLADQVADLATFNCLREDSTMLAYVNRIKNRRTGVTGLHWAEHRELTLQSQPGFLVTAMKSKHRSWIRKKIRDLESAFPAETRWHWHTKIEEVISLCEQIEKVAARTYQRGLDAGFKNDEEHRSRFSLFARRGVLRIMIFEINHQPAAFWLGVVYNGTFHSEATGYVTELAEYEIGTQIFLRMVDELVREGVHKFDFGLGDAHYKQRFGDFSWRETSIRLFRRDWKMNVLRGYLAPFEMLDRVLRRLVNKFGVVDSIKQIWRRRLAHKIKSAETETTRSSKLGSH